MADAKEIILLWQREESKAANYRTMCQNTANLVFPRENQIITSQTPGVEKMNKVFDSTAIMASQDMASGLSINLVPPGQKFFSLKAVDRELREVEEVKVYLSKATEIAHDQLFDSNFLLQLNETLRSLISFGTGNIYSEYKTRLNFKDYDIAMYLYLENSEGRVDTMLLRYPLTARQAMQEFDNPGPTVTEAVKDEKKQYEQYEFIEIIRPREFRNMDAENTLNMPFEHIVVAVKDTEVIFEGGFSEFPFSVPRWMKSSYEKYGRGQGTESLPDVRMLNDMKKTFNELSNRHASPPLEILESFEGNVNVTPNAQNFVQEIPSIQGIKQSVLGNFPVTKDALEMQRDVVKDYWFSKAFAPLTELKGDRRTVPEIQERVQEAFRKIGAPIGRLQSELFTPMLTRVVLLLIRNGVIPYPPGILQRSRGFGIEYIGPLSLALKSSEVRASQQWIEVVSVMEDVFPGAKDNVDSDSAIRRMGRTFGVNEEDIATEEEVTVKREARAEELQRQQALEMAQLAAQGYSQTTKAPEEGSAAGQIQEAIGV